MSVTRLSRFTVVVGLFVSLWLLLPFHDAAANRAGQRSATPSAPLVAFRDVDPRFGVVESFWVPEEAAALRVGWDRILFYWNEIQPTGPDSWNTLHVLEEWLDDARLHNRTVVGLLKNTPAWATDGPPFSGVPRGLYLPVDDPDNLWAVYVGKVVDYYAPLGVHNWIIWNEPEIEVGVYGHEFDGDVNDYYQLVKVAYQVAKARDPEAVIHLAGYSYWHDPAYLRQLLGVIAADPEGPANNFFFDVLSLHIYFRVETVEELVREAYSALRSYRLPQPVWINETNASPNLDPLWPVERPMFQVDNDQQAWYIVQAHALGFGAGADSIGVYKLLDILLPPGGESFGILRPDKSRRPAFDAYRTTVERLSGFEPPVGRERTRDYYAFSFIRPEDVTRVLWARTAAVLQMRVPALTDTAELITANGESQTIRARDGFYEIRLEGARCAPACDIGGPPVFLVEQRSDIGELPTPAPSPTPLPTATPTPVLTTTEQVTSTVVTEPVVVPFNPNRGIPTIGAAAILTTTLTPVPTASPTLSVTLTATPTATPVPTETPTQTATPTATPTGTATPSPTATASPAATVTRPPTTPDTVPTEAISQADAGTGGTGLLSRVGSFLVLGAALVLGLLLVLRYVRRTG